MTLTPEERDEVSHLPLPSCRNRSPFLESSPSPPAAVISRQALPAPGSQLHSNRVLWKGLETEFATVSPEGSGTISIDLSQFSIRARGRGHSHLSSSSPSPSGLVPRGGTVLTQPPPAAAFLSAPTLSVSPALCLTHLSFGFSLLPFRVSRTLSFLCPTFCRRVFLCSQPLALCVCITVFLFFCLWASGSSWPCLALICPHLLEPRSSLLKG